MLSPEERVRAAVRQERAERPQKRTPKPQTPARSLRAAIAHERADGLAQPQQRVAVEPSAPSAPPTAPPLEFGTSEAARILGVSMGTVRRWADMGRLECSWTPGGVRRFSRGQIEAFLASCVRN